MEVRRRRNPPKRFRRADGVAPLVLERVEAHFGFSPHPHLCQQHCVVVAAAGLKRLDPSMRWTRESE